jgi:hypothetical protein
VAEPAAVKDTILHTILAIVGAAVNLALFTWLPPFFAAALTGWLGYVYFREVTQRQTGKSLSFEQGWLPWRWISADGKLNVQKVVETVGPLPPVLIAAYLLTQVFG